MKISTLKNKLSKLNIEVKEHSFNDFNKHLLFSINGKSYEADFNSVEQEVVSYSYARGYCESSQETLRTFFDNFAQVLRHSKR